jgi:hypothetical protein
MASVRIKEDDVMKRQSRRDFLAATAAMAVSAVITGHARTSQSPSKSPGLPTTWGIPTAKDWIAEDDAVVIARLKACGFRQAPACALRVAPRPLERPKAMAAILSAKASQHGAPA